MIICQILAITSLSSSWPAIQIYQVTYCIIMIYPDGTKANSRIFCRTSNNKFVDE